MQWPDEELELRWRSMDEFLSDLQNRLTHIRGELAVVKHLAASVVAVGSSSQPTPVAPTSPALTTVDAPSPAPAVPAHAPISQGFTGNMCAICGGSHMVRSGTCELCMDCGSTTGCS